MQSRALASRAERSAVSARVADNFMLRKGAGVRLRREMVKACGSTRLASKEVTVSRGGSSGR